MSWITRFAMMLEKYQKGMSLIPEPLFLLNLTRYYLSYVNRPWILDKEKMKKYQGKMLRKIVKRAFTTSTYSQKYQEAGILPDDIKNIEDIQKLPLMTKDDLRRDPAISKNFKKRNLYKVDTSGSTGKPVSIYRDISSIIIESLIIARMLKAYNLNIFKTRITNIGDFSLPNSYDEECLRKVLSKKLGFFSHRTQSLYVGEDMKKMMGKLEKFDPHIIIAYPGTLIGLMILREDGHGKKLKLKYIISSGGVLDDYTKNQIEDAFSTKILDLYTATESGTIAFECLEGNYHIQSDYVYLEALNDDGEKVIGKPGHVVVTRLYGKGNPIIRYTGMNDFVTPIEGECDCGMHTPLIKSVEGRSSDSIVLPDGRIFPPATFTLIPGEVMREFGIDKIQQFQIIQNRKDEIEILIVIKEEFRDVPPPIEDIMNEIQRRYQHLVGKGVEIKVREAKHVRKEDSISPILISHVDHKNWI